MNTQNGSSENSGKEEYKREIRIPPLIACEGQMFLYRYEIFLISLISRHNIFLISVHLFYVFAIINWSHCIFYLVAVGVFKTCCFTYRIYS